MSSSFLKHTKVLPFFFSLGRILVGGWPFLTILFSPRQCLTASEPATSSSFHSKCMRVLEDLQPKETLDSRAIRQTLNDKLAHLLAGRVRAPRPVRVADRAARAQERDERPCPSCNTTERCSGYWGDVQSKGGHTSQPFGPMMRREAEYLQGIL